MLMVEDWHTSWDFHWKVGSDCSFIGLYRSQKLPTYSPLWLRGFMEKRSCVEYNNHLPRIIWLCSWEIFRQCCFCRCVALRCVALWKTDIVLNERHVTALVSFICRIILVDFLFETQRVKRNTCWDFVIFILPWRSRFTTALRCVMTALRCVMTASGTQVGDNVFVQNQTGFSPTKWDRTGTVIEVKPKKT